MMNGIRVDGVEFREVPGFEGCYAIAEDGRLWSFWRDRLLQGVLNHQAYLRYRLTDSEKNLAWFLAHRLVFVTWVRALEPGELVLHRDDDKGNNRPENLYVGTSRQNTQDMIRNGTAAWLAKTHCPKGHEYTEENTYHQPQQSGRPGRVCRECRRNQDRVRRNKENPK